MPRGRHKASGWAIGKGGTVYRVRDTRKKKYRTKAGAKRAAKRR